MLKATIVTPSLGAGGAERWIIDIIRSTNTRIEWNVVASGWGLIDRTLLDELLTLVTVYGNKPSINVGGISIPLIDNNYDGIEITGSEFGEAVKVGIEHSDFVITWAIPNIGEYIGEYKKPVIYVSHTDVRSPVEIYGHTHQVGVSKQSLNHFLNTDKPTCTIWNGANPRVGTDLETWEIVKEWKGPKPIIGQIGRHVPLKQYMLTAKAVSKNPKLMLVNYGAGPDGEICQKLEEFCRESIQDYYLSKPIKLIGSAISNFEVIVMPSTQEANSLAVIEAMLCRVPIISTNVGAIPEFEEEFGEMINKIPVDINPDALCDKITQVINENNDDLVENNYQIAKEHMTIEAMGNRWYNYILSL